MNKLSVEWAINPFSKINYDLDVSAFVTIEDKRLNDPMHFVYFRNKSCTIGGNRIVQLEQHQTEGVGGKEQLTVSDPSEFPTWLNSIDIILTIDEPEGKTFGLMDDAVLEYDILGVKNKLKIGARDPLANAYLIGRIIKARVAGHDEEQWIFEDAMVPFDTELTTIVDEYDCIR